MNVRRNGGFSKRTNELTHKKVVSNLFMGSRLSGDKFFLDSGIELNLNIVEHVNFLKYTKRLCKETAR